MEATNQWLSSGFHEILFFFLHLPVVTYPSTYESWDFTRALRTVINDALNPKEPGSWRSGGSSSISTVGGWSLALRTRWKSPQPCPVRRQKTDRSHPWQLESFLRMNGISTPLQTWSESCRGLDNFSGVEIQFLLSLLPVSHLVENGEGLWRRELAPWAPGVFMTEQI